MTVQTTKIPVKYPQWRLLFWHILGLNRNLSAWMVEWGQNSNKGNLRIILDWLTFSNWLWSIGNKNKLLINYSGLPVQWDVRDIISVATLVMACAGFEIPLAKKVSPWYPSGNYVNHNSHSMYIATAMWKVSRKKTQATRGLDEFVSGCCGHDHSSEHTGVPWALIPEV